MTGGEIVSSGVYGKIMSSCMMKYSFLEWLWRL